MNNFVVHHNFILSEFNRSWMFSKQILPIVITLQVLHYIFKLISNKNKMFVVYIIVCLHVMFVILPLKKILLGSKAKAPTDSTLYSTRSSSQTPLHTPKTYTFVGDQGFYTIHPRIME